mgnify:CR=1 FL=1
MPILVGRRVLAAPPARSVYDKQIALGATRQYFRTRSTPTLFEVYVEMQARQDRGRGRAAHGRSDRRGPSRWARPPRELQKAKNLLEAEFVKQLKTNNGVGEQLGVLRAHVRRLPRAVRSPSIAIAR